MGTGDNVLRMHGERFGYGTGEGGRPAGSEIDNLHASINIHCGTIDVISKHLNDLRAKQEIIRVIADEAQRIRTDDALADRIALSNAVLRIRRIIDGVAE